MPSTSRSAIWWLISRRGDETSTATGRTLWELLYFGDRSGSGPAGQRVLTGHQA
jgi:hypothetical protein